MIREYKVPVYTWTISFNEQDETESTVDTKQMEK
jgi:hypothetical protein